MKDGSKLKNFLRLTTLNRDLFLTRTFWDLKLLMFMFLGLLCALEIREEKLLHEPKDIAKSQDYKVLERLFEELTKCKEDDQQREFFLVYILLSVRLWNFKDGGS